MPRRLGGSTSTGGRYGLGNGAGGGRTYTSWSGHRARGFPAEQQPCRAAFPSRFTHHVSRRPSPARPSRHAGLVEPAGGLVPELGPAAAVVLGGLFLLRRR